MLRYVPILVAVLTFLFSLSVTHGLWQNAQASNQRYLQTEFDFRVRETTTQIVQRMDTYEQVLRSTKAHLQGDLHTVRNEFQSYVKTLGLAEKFPGIQAIGISEIIPASEVETHIASVRGEGFKMYTVWPSHERQFYTSITRIEPFDPLNRRAFGFDMYSEPVRRAAMERARDTGTAALTGRVILVQEFQTDIQAGFLMYLPVYQRGLPTNTIEQRHENILGWVYAPFRINDFMRGLGGERSTDLDITLYDGTAMSDQACLFGCSPSSKSSLLHATGAITIAGRPWTLDIRSTPAFERRLVNNTPWFIAVGGATTAVLLSVLIWSLATGRTRALSLARKITEELKASHDHLEAEQRRIKVILENSHEAFVAIDTRGAITDWNRQAERTFGWSAIDVIGSNLEEVIIPQDQRAAHNEGFRRFVLTGTGPVINNRIEVMALHRDGRLIPIELAIVAITGESGYTANAFIRDLTERKEIEKREAQRQRALEETRQALQHAQKLEAVGKLTGGVAHDFNNVLQIISGNIQLLQHDIGTKEQRDKRLLDILSAVDKASNLSSQLLAFARRQPLRPQVVNICILLDRMDDMLRRALGAAIAVERAVWTTYCNTIVDPDQLENVILNLVINARDAMQGQGKLVIEVSHMVLDDKYVQPVPELSPGPYVMLAISDTGTGMAAEVMEQAFEPFFTTKPVGEGTGLGLSMAYGFVKQSGGHIKIYSELGHGTTVRIYLPSVNEPEQASPTKANVDIVAGGSETILVVEDDVNVQSSVVAMLEGLGYRVLKANDGASALQVLEGGAAVDLLFTDVVMPGPVQSTALVEQAKNRIPNISVLFTSGYTRNAIVHGGRLAPGVTLLSKPYRREQLARTIRQLLDQKSSVSKMTWV